MVPLLPKQMSSRFKHKATLLELAQSTAGTSEWRFKEAKFKDVSTLIAQLPAGMSTKDAVALVQASAREIVAAMLANTNGFARISGSRGSRRLPSPTSRWSRLWCGCLRHA